jgi:diguanylate cyclase (GGDEF)-like protein
VLHTGKRKTHFILIISLLLIIGFSSISFVSYFVASNSINQYIRANTLPLTSDNIYSEIQRDVLPTVIISSLMAQDTFVRDWIINGEQDIPRIKNYLQSIQQRYKTDTAFFISDKTLNYYHSTGLIKQVSNKNTADAWYFRVSKIQDDFEINVDVDTVDKQKTTIFVNYKIFNYDGQYIGIIGVGLSSAVVKNQIKYYQDSYDRQVYFVEPSGQITLSDENLHTHSNIHQTEGLASISEQVLSSPNGSYTYTRQGKEVFLNARFVPELGWYLLVEQIGRPESHIQKTLWVNLFVSLVITVIVLILAHLTVQKYQRRLITMATTDKLTGLHNRHAFDVTFKQSIKVTSRDKQPLSIVLIDIDHFKNINDNYGHLGGDKVLCKLANILTHSMRESDFLCRWGGEEFIMLLPKCNLEQAAALAEKTRSVINSDSTLIKDENINISASFGVSQYLIGETREQFIKRVDSALYRAKIHGRNRVEQA